MRRGKRGPTVAETFDDHWIEAPDTGCWIWQRAQAGKYAKIGKGYGCLSVKGAVTRAHAFAWERVNGPVPEGLHLLHECDNPTCVNPAHLHPGTNEENMKDKAVRETGAYRKVSSEDIRHIRRRVAGGEKQRVIGAEYGLCQSYISQVCSKRYRRHVD